MSVNIDPAIGGPSAGLMFSLGIYDTLTPGSLTGGERRSPAPAPIDGSGQRRADRRHPAEDRRRPGRRRASCSWCPPDNCDDAKGAPNGDMRLVKAATMHSAVQSIEAWVKDHDADAADLRSDT